jgi:hypothetical protein
MGTNNSARGRIALNYNDAGEIVMQDGLNYDQWEKLSHADNSVMKRVFLNGEFTRKYSFEEVRNNLRNGTI